jgi:hypothetical protein
MKPTGTTGNVPKVYRVQKVVTASAVERFDECFIHDGLRAESMVMSDRF